MFYSVYRFQCDCKQRSGCKFHDGLSLYFLTFGVFSVFSCDVNLALVKIFFKFGGCRLLGIIVIFLSFCFILEHTFKIEIDCVIMD